MNLLQTLQKAIETTPSLKELTVVEMAMKDLENGGTERSAIARLRVDLDKLLYWSGAETICDYIKY